MKAASTTVFGTIRTAAVRLGVILAASILLVAILRTVDAAFTRRPLASLAIEPSVIHLDQVGHRDVTVRLEPRLHPPAGGFPWIFVHLIGPRGKIARTFDHRPPGWFIGETMEYPLTVDASGLIEPLAPGEYTLVAGAYDPERRQRFALDTDGKGDGRRAYRLASVSISDERRPDLKLEYSGGWEAVEPTGDRQVPSRRFWRDSAAIEVQGPIEEALEMRLQVLVLELPPTAEPRPAAELAVRVSCADDPPALVGGRHQFRVEMPPLAAGESCEIALDAMLIVEEEGFPRPRSAALEAISWRVLDR